MTTTKQYHIIKAYVCEGSISLSKEYLTRIADGKFTVDTLYAVMDDFAFSVLNECKEYDFNYDYYFQLLNNEDQKATHYMNRHDRSISVNSFGIDLFETMEDARDSLN